ncbi:response regulator transcription factor [Cupriavidus pauculus]|uniref:HTH luxR-type domain-containing protein n=1 Tax=Cupriavidus pauculus TaxID=82633 RepID=A0A2N5CDD7_9BURK|nr:hypothetical protein CYJ10_11410 [Cupriavidus pauculus]
MQAQRILSVTLTQREREVLRLIASGMSCRALAAALQISVLTARKHRSNLLMGCRAPPWVHRTCRRSPRRRACHSRTRRTRNALWPRAKCQRRCRGKTVPDVNAGA